MLTVVVVNKNRLGKLYESALVSFLFSCIFFKEGLAKVTKYKENELCWTELNLHENVISYRFAITNY